MPKIDIPFVDLGGENEEFHDEILKSISAIIKSGSYILGKNIDEFEKSVCKKLGTEFCVGLNSGGDALMLGLIALNLSKDSNIVVPANSFIASAWAVVNSGLNLNYCDVSEDMNASAKNFQDASNTNTAGWMPVHLTGSPCDINSFKASELKGIKIIEDAAQAFGASFDEVKIGSWGEFSGFSLNPLKVLGVIGDGGFLATNNEKIANKVRLLRNHGMHKRDDTSCWGFNSRLDEIQAKIASIKLKK